MFLLLPAPSLLLPPLLLFFFLSLSLSLFSSSFLSSFSSSSTSLLNVFYLNLCCVHNFCFVLLNFTCLRVAVCLSMFLLIELFFKHIINHCSNGLLPGPSGYDHRISGSGTWMENVTRLCPKNNAVFYEL